MRAANVYHGDCLGALSPLQSAGRTPKLSRQPSIELPSMAVASTKTRWETGEVQSQSASKTPSCQVGVLPRQAKLGRLRMGS